MFISPKARVGSKVQSVAVIYICNIQRMNLHTMQFERLIDPAD